MLHDDRRQRERLHPTGDFDAFRKFAAHAAAGIAEVETVPPDHVDLGAGMQLPADALPADLQSKHTMWSKRLKNAMDVADHGAAEHARDQLADVAHEASRRVAFAHTERLARRRLGRV